MDIGHTKMFSEHFIGDGEVHILRKTIGDSVIDVIVGVLVAEEGRRKNSDKSDQKNRSVFDDKLADFAKTGENALVVEL